MQPVVTTAPSGDPAEAHALARDFALAFEPRDGRPLAQVLAGGAPVLVVAARRADLYLGATRFRASVGMAYLRVLRSRSGEIDPLVAAAGLRKGDRVLDATLGLGGDALLAAHVPHAPVVGLEADGLVGAFARVALCRLPPHAREAGARIEVRHADHRTWLREQPDRSFDVVLLDPMFRSAGDASPLFDLLRLRAEHAPLTPETLREAQRVARRGVLIKDAAPGKELKRLGLVPNMTRRS